MSETHRVIWSQGMFLRPHHFQQQDRHFDDALNSRIFAAHHHAWGFGELRINEAALSSGQVALDKANGVLPDGTVFALGEYDAAPASLEIPSDLKDELICLSVPRARVGATEVDWENDSASRSSARWKAQTVRVRDMTQSSDDPDELQVGKLNFRLTRARDLGDGMAALAIARVHERRAQQVILDSAFIAPQYRVDATRQLSASATLVHGLIQQQAQNMASTMGHVAHGVSEISEFLKLMVLNRGEPIWRQLAAAQHSHPSELHEAMLGLLGELATFEEPARRPPTYPIYRHDDLHGTFAPLLLDLRRLLSAAPLRRAVPIELIERKNGVFTAVVGEVELLDTATFVLAVNAHVPAEHLRQQWPGKFKFAPPNRLASLVRGALPGVAIRPLASAPRQLPFHAGFQYFELDPRANAESQTLWQQLKPEGAVAMHVAGEFPGLQMEFWAIRA